MLREQIPDKMYKDCCNCPRLNSCDEVAMVRGEVPTTSILDLPANHLVRLSV